MFILYQPDDGQETPDAYDKPEERGVEWLRNPELMKQCKQQRLEAERKGTQHLPDR